MVWGSQELNTSELALKLSAYSGSFRAKFNQTKRLKKMNISLRSEGELTVMRPDRVLWRIVKPSPLSVVVGREGIKIASGSGANESVQEVKSGASSLEHLIVWLRLDAESIVKNFHVSLDGHEILFRPRRADGLPLEAIRARRSSLGHLDRITLLENSGDQIILDLEKPEPIP